MHTHFNHPAEITGVTHDALNRLTERGILVRCQTVLQRTVNDSAATMQLLVRRLCTSMSIPTTSIFTTWCRGWKTCARRLPPASRLRNGCAAHTAGFNTPAFVVDTPGGGGKRDAHSFEFYDRASGIAVFTSPAVKPGKKFLYFDPVTLAGRGAPVALDPAFRAPGDDRRGPRTGAPGKLALAGAGGNQVTRSRGERRARNQSARGSSGGLPCFTISWRVKARTK